MATRGNVRGRAIKLNTGQRSKFGAVKTVVDGMKFDSKKEAKYYTNLVLLQKAGEIKSFEMQVPFILQPKFRTEWGTCIREIKYVADFVIEYPDGHKEVVDVKGFRTKEYNLKKKMFLYVYRGVMFKEV